jgi:hypothetical protein
MYHKKINMFRIHIANYAKGVKFVSQSEKSDEKDKRQAPQR